MPNRDPDLPSGHPPVALVFAGGDPPAPGTLDDLDPSTILVAADSGLAHARALGARRRPGRRRPRLGRSRADLDAAIAARDGRRAPPPDEGRHRPRARARRRRAPGCRPDRGRRRGRRSTRPLPRQRAPARRPAFGRRRHRGADRRRHRRPSCARPSSSGATLGELCTLLPVGGPADGVTHRTGSGSRCAARTCSPGSTPGRQQRVPAPTAAVVTRRATACSSRSAPAALRKGR